MQVYATQCIAPQYTTFGAISNARPSGKQEDEKIDAQKEVLYNLAPGANTMGRLPQASTDERQLGRTDRWVVGGAALVILIFLLATPADLWGKLTAVGYAVCHQIPERSFSFNGHPLPLCARCTGTFSAALWVFISAAARGRGRAGQLPPVRVALVLVGFILIWAVDGLNSYLNLIDMPHVYTPHNWLRFVTGNLNGIALGNVILPIFNLALWRHPQPCPNVKNLHELGTVIGTVGVFAGLVLVAGGPLHLLAGLLSTLGVLWMLTAVNTVIVLILAKWENRAIQRRQALAPILASLALSLVMVLGIGAARDLLIGDLDLPH